jgi:hypothetical protein
MSRLSAKQNEHQTSKLLKNHAMCVQINFKAALLYLTAIPVELNLKFCRNKGKKRDMVENGVVIRISYLSSHCNPKKNETQTRCSKS